MFLEGKRIYLREVTQDDIGNMYHSWLADNEVTKNLECRYFPQSIDNIRAYVSSMKAPDNTLFAIIVKEAGDIHIGNIRLGPVSWQHRFAGIGLLIGNKQFWGKGYGTEAISLVRDYAFGKLSLHKLTAGCYSCNLASVRAFEKAGFVREGLLRRQYYTELGQRTDEVVLGCLADEYHIWNIFPTVSSTDYSFRLSPEAAASIASQRE